MTISVTCYAVFSSEASKNKQNGKFKELDGSYWNRQKSFVSGDNAVRYAYTEMIDARKETEARRQEEREEEERNRRGRKIKQAVWTDGVVGNIDFSYSPKSWEEGVARNIIRQPSGRTCVRACPLLRGVVQEGRY